MLKLRNVLFYTVACLLLVACFDDDDEPNRAPNIENIPDQSIENTGAEQSIGLGISDDRDALSDLMITATSDNQSLLPDSALSVALGSASVDLTFLPNAILGSVNITVQASDSAGLSSSESFTLDVVAEQLSFSELTRKVFSADENATPQSLDIVEIEEGDTSDDFNDLL